MWNNRKKILNILTGSMTIIATVWLVIFLYGFMYKNYNIGFLIVHAITILDLLVLFCTKRSHGKKARRLFILFVILLAPGSFYRNESLSLNISRVYNICCLLNVLLSFKYWDMRYDKVMMRKYGLDKKNKNEKEEKIEPTAEEAKKAKRGLFVYLSLVVFVDLLIVLVALIYCKTLGFSVEHMPIYYLAVCFFAHWNVMNLYAALKLYSRRMYLE